MYKGCDSMKKRFGIDIDGTVTTADAILPFINKDFQLQLTLEDITEYDLTPFVNVDEQEFSNWYLKNESLIYQQSPIKENAAEILNKWKQNHELYFISARGINMLEVTKQWFKKEKISYNHIELIGSHDKIQAVKKYEIDLFIEDKHDNAVAIHEQCGIPVLLFDTPYNQMPIPEGVIRIYTWEDADNWVTNWLKEKSIL